MTKQNPNLILDEIAIEMVLLQQQGVTHAHVCLFRGKIMLRCSKHTNIEHHIIRKLTPYELLHGLKPHSWDRLAKQIAASLEGANLCHVPQKPLL